MTKGARDYDVDPELYAMPLTPDDLAWLPDPDSMKPSAKRDPFTHLSSRAMATARELRAIRVRFDHEVRRRVDMHARSTTVAGSVSPRDAVKFLSQAEIEDIFDTYAKQRLAALESQRQAALDDSKRAEHAVSIAVAALQQAAAETQRASTQPAATRHEGQGNAASSQQGTGPRDTYQHVAAMLLGIAQQIQHEAVNPGVPGLPIPSLERDTAGKSDHARPAHPAHPGDPDSPGHPEHHGLATR